MSQFWPATPIDTGWIAPALLTGWSTPAGFAPVRYRRVGGLVEMQGAATGAVAGDPLFTLPAGFRPDVSTGTIYFLANNGSSTSGGTRVAIRANGEVVAVVSTTPCFDVVRFRAA